MANRDWKTFLLQTGDVLVIQYKRASHRGPFDFCVKTFRIRKLLLELCDHFPAQLRLYAAHMP